MSPATTRRSLVLLCLTSAFLFAPGCGGVKTHVQVGEATNQSVFVPHESPTPELDALFFERHLPENMEAARVGYWRWLEERKGGQDLANSAHEHVMGYLNGQDWGDEHYHVLMRLADIHYAMGLQSLRDRKESAEHFLVGVELSRAALRTNEAYAEALELGVDGKDAIAHVQVDQIAAVDRLASTLGRYSESRGVVAQLAGLPELVALYARVHELDPNWYAGSGHIGLGAIYVMVPKSFGGDIELGGAHLRRAMEIDPSYLDTKVVYAEYYLLPKKMREEFDALLQGVLDHPDEPGPYRFENRMAQLKARELQEQADRRF